MRRLSLFVFLIVGVVIGLGAFGHGHAAQKVHAAIDQFPIDPVIATTLYIVWYFVSGCMILFGAAIIWMWFRLRAGDVSSLFVAYLIGALYVVAGVGGMGLGLPGLKHAGGDFGDEAAGDQAFAVSAKIVSKAGDDVTFSSRERLQPRARDFFCGFHAALEFLLAGNGVEFRFRRAGAKGAHANSVRLHLFGKAFGEKQIERFRGGVGGDIRNGLEGSGGSENEHIAMPARDHFRQIQPGKMDDRVTIHLHHVKQTLFFNG